MDAAFNTTAGRVRVLMLEEARKLALWAQAFAGEAKDHSYYEIVDHSLGGQFEFRYLVLEGADGEARGVQPFFFAEQDITATAPSTVRRGVEYLRRIFPGFLRLKMLMAGCAAGEGRLGAPTAEAKRDLVAAAAEAFPELARKHGARLIVWKDFGPADREPLRLVKAMRMASMPATSLELKFTSFEEFMAQHLGHATRKDLRRKFKATRDRPLELQVTECVHEVVEEVHDLYCQVLARSPLQFERLPKAFFLDLGERLPESARVFLWRHEGRLVACSICLEHDGVLYDEYLGLDYRVALDWHLYFVTLRDVLGWAMERGLKSYRSTPLNYAPKRQLGFVLEPLDVYVTAPALLVRVLLSIFRRWIEPTRAEPVLRDFDRRG